MTRLVLLLKSGPGSGSKIAHQGGYAMYGNPPRWHKITPEKPAPKGAPVSHHPEAAGVHEPAQHFTDAQWSQLKLPDTNVNAPSYNAALAKLRAWSEAGNVTAIVAAGYGTNTYGKKLATIANQLLKMHGSVHQVASGQKAGEHLAVAPGADKPAKATGTPAEQGAAAFQAGKPASPAHDAAFAAKVAGKPDAAQKLNEWSSGYAEAKAAATPKPTGPLVAPEFTEGKTTTGVKALYDHTAAKIIDHGHAGNLSVLQDMVNPDKKMWQGKTPNSKKLVQLHAQALAHATGAQAPGAASTSDDSLDGLKLPAAVKEYLLKPSVTMKDGKTISSKEYVDGLLADGYGNPEYFAAPKGSQAGFLTKPGKPKVTLNDKQMFYADAAFVAAKKAAKAPAVEPKFKPGQAVVVSPDLTTEHAGMSGAVVEAKNYGTDAKPDYHFKVKLQDGSTEQFQAGELERGGAKAAPEPFQIKSAKQGNLLSEGAVYHLQADDYSGVEKALGLKPGALADSDSTTYTVTDHKGRTFSVYKHGGALSVRTSGANKDHTSAQELLDHLKAANADTGPKEGDTKPGANGGTLVLKNGRWVKQGGGEPPVLFPQGSAWNDVVEGAFLAHKKGDIDALADFEAEAKAAVSDHGKKALAYIQSLKGEVKPEHFEVNTGDVFKLDSQYQKMNAGEWVVYNISADGAQVYMHKVGAKVPNQTNSATIPAATLAEAVAKGTATKQGGASDLDSPEVMAADFTKPAAPATAPTGNLSAQHLQNLQSIPWFKLKLPDSNTNAKSHNAALAKIEAMAFAGDKAGLQAFIDAKAGAKQTYAKKQALVAQTALAALGADGATAAVPVEPAPSATDELKAAGEAKAKKKAEAIAAVEALGLGIQVSPSKGLLLASNKGGMANIYTNQTQASSAAQKLADAGIDAEVIGMHPYFVKVHGVMPGAKPSAPAPAADKVTELSPKQIEGLKGWFKAGKPTSKHPDSWSNLWSKLSPGMKAAVKAELEAEDPPAEAVPPPAAADKYPLVNEWKAAISAGKVPTKAQADAYEALVENDPDSATEYFMDAVNNLIPEDKLNDDDAFDDALQEAHSKAFELHGHALNGTKPAQAAPAPVTAPASPAKVKVDAPLYENTTPGHNKFWSVSTSGKVMKTEYGKIGTKGTSTVKTFPSEQAAKNAAVKLMDEKKAKGYVYKGAVKHEHDAAVEQGPKEGDTKQGADGLLVLKDGHWVKVDKDPAGDMGGWSYDPEDMAMSGAPTLNFEKEGQTVYVAKTDDGYQVGAMDADGDPLDHSDHAFLSDAVAAAAKNHGVTIPVSALKKLDPLYEAPKPASFKKLTHAQIGEVISSITPTQSTFSTNTYGKAATKAATKGDAAGMAAAYKGAKQAMKFPKTAQHIKAVAEAMGVDTSGWMAGYYDVKAAPPGAAAPAAPAAAPASPAGGLPSMDSWVKTGDQKGSNPGGKFKDPDGQEWYCKWPDDAEAAKSEVLAAKLYALAGLSSQDCMLVSKGGKTAIATKWVNIKKAGSAAALAKVEGVHQGFAVDAWLGNWDVVGMSLDNLQIGPDGKAHRVDAGGSLEYRAQGEKKPFGSKVEEIDTLRDMVKNPHAAAVFAKMTQADIAASVTKVAGISDIAIRAMVNQFGPGDDAAKKKLADTLIARKQDLISKYPQAAKPKKKPKFDPAKISAPPSFLNWGGTGKSGPSSKAFLNQANEDAVQAIYQAAKSGDLEAVKHLTAPVYDKDSGSVTGNKPVLDHPSQHVKGYAQQVINEINYQLNPPKRFRFDGGHPLHALNHAYPAHKGASSSKVAQKLGKFIVLGEPGTVKLEDIGLPAKIKHAEGGGTLSASTYAAASKAAFAKMPTTQKQAVKSYTGSSYHEMNGSLWSGNPSGAAKAAGEALKTLGHDIAPGTVLSRKISVHGDDLKNLLAAQGKILEEPAIMSTSIRPSSWSGNVHLKLHIGPGVKGLWVGHGSDPTGGAMSKHGGEDEMILPPNTRLLVLSSKPGGSKDADGFGSSSSHVIECIVLPTQ